MSRQDDLRPVVDMLIEGDVEAANEHLLMENEEQRIIRALGGDRTPFDYLLKFVEFLDSHDIFLFDGWEGCEISHKPVIDRFWCTFYVFVPSGTDLRGALRLTTEKEGQTTVKQKKVGNGHLLMFKILRRDLDEIEAEDQERAEDLSDKEMEHL